MNVKDLCHLMIDIETYSFRSNGVIRSIGGVKFSLTGGKSEALFHYGIDIESALLVGLVVDDSTVRFWRDQPEENRDRLVNMPKENLKEVLESVENQVKDAFKDIGMDKVYLWSHGSNFDIVLLENAYMAVGIKPWWKYSNVRDTRTLFDFAEYTYKAKGGHDALEDAVSQAEAVQEAYQQLRGEVM